MWVALYVPAAGVSDVSLTMAIFPPPPLIVIALVTPVDISKASALNKILRAFPPAGAIVVPPAIVILVVAITLKAPVVSVVPP